MEFTAAQIAQLVGGKVEGDENAKVYKMAKIEYGEPGAISFLSNPKYEHYLYETKSTIVLVNDSLKLEKPVEATLIRVPNAYESVAKLLQMYASMTPKKEGIDSLAFIHPTAKVGKNVYVGAFAYIGENVTVGDGTQIYPHTVVCEEAKIGENTILYPNVTIYHHCIVGNNCILHGGVVIGADGFGFAPGPQGYDKIPQIGIVTVEDNVEIGANTCVDRSTMGSTYIRKGVKLDNLVQIGHNVEVGSNTVMSAQSGIAGSTKVGQWCMVGGQAGITGHAHITDKVQIGAQCGVISSIEESGTTYIGSPAMEPRGFFKSMAVVKKLPDMYREMAAMKKEIEELKKKAGIDNGEKLNKE